MSKKFLLIYCILFFAMCLFWPVMTLVSGAGENKTNRGSVPMPEISGEDGFNSDFPTEFEEYFKDQLAFRNELVTAYHGLSGFVLGDVNDAQGILGKEGYLFFTETLPDFQRSSTLTYSQIQSIAANLKMLQDQLNAQDITFVFAIAPNKNSIYPEYMPDRYGQSENPSNLTMLQSALAQHGVNYVDLQSELLAHKGDEPLYFKHDTHWNALGASIAYQAIIASARHPKFEYYAPGEYTWRYDYGGDLAGMVYPALEGSDAQAEFADLPEYRYSRPPRSLEDMRIKTTSQQGENKLLMVRDSFANALIPFFSGNFAECYYERETPFPYYRVEETGADLVVWEVAERNLPALLDAVPIMETPVSW